MEHHCTQKKNPSRKLLRSSTAHCVHPPSVQWAWTAHFTVECLRLPLALPMIPFNFVDSLMGQPTMVEHLDRIYSQDYIPFYTVFSVQIRLMMADLRKEPQERDAPHPLLTTENGEGRKKSDIDVSKWLRFYDTRTRSQTSPPVSQIWHRGNSNCCTKSMATTTSSRAKGASSP